MNELTLTVSILAVITTVVGLVSSYCEAADNK